MKKDKKDSKDKKYFNPEIIKNKKALFNYELVETLEAGIVLVGTEVKSLRERSVNISDSYATFKNGEVFIVNLHISPYNFGNINNHNPLRMRKLLLKKREIKRLYGKTKEQGLTLVPVKLYFARGKVKLELALARGKKNADKRETIKRRIADKEMGRYLKNNSRK